MSDDLDDIVIDGAGTFVVAWLPFLTIVALIVIVGFLATRLAKLKKGI